jgi:hypothetical protein
MTEERIGKNAVKTAATHGKRVTTTAYAKVLKTLVQDDVHMLKQPVNTEERVAKIINAKDRLIVLDLFKATTKVTTETIVAVIVAATNK